MYQLDIDIRQFVDEGLLHVRVYENGLAVLKYTGKAHFSNAFEKYPELKELRGMVIDKDLNIITYPFTHLSHYNESLSLPKNTPFIGVEKINGFMGALSIYEGNPLISTTGTLDSDYAKLAMTRITESLGGRFDELDDGMTFIFEIVDPSDPHIVEQEPGVYLIGVRCNQLYSAMATEESLDEMAKCFPKLKRPTYYKYPNIQSLLNDAYHSKNEGVIIRSANCGVYFGQKPLFKVKSYLYSAKKKLMRMRDSVVDMMYEDKYDINNIDPSYQDLVFDIQDTYSREDWKKMDEQARRKEIERFLKM